MARYDIACALCSSDDKEPMMDDADQDAATAALEEAFTRYMRSRTDGSETFVLEGYIFQAFGRTMENLENYETSHVWGHMEGQQVHTTIGLARMLNVTVEDWYVNGEPRVDED